MLTSGDAPAEDFRDRDGRPVDIELGTGCENIGQGYIARLGVACTYEIEARP